MKGREVYFVTYLAFSTFEAVHMEMVRLPYSDYLPYNQIISWFTKIMQQGQ